MLTLWGQGGDHRFCDGHSRRSFLKLGGLAMGGLALPELLRAEEATPAASAGGAGTGARASGSSHKSVIMIYLTGGPSHQDTFDLKPDAPEGIRGEYRPIDTRVPGIQICEHLPRLAGMMDKVAVIRSIVGLRDEHSSAQTITGYPMGQAVREGRPNFGSVIARMQGPVDPVVPPFIDLSPVMKHKPYSSPGPGFLGHTYKPARMEGDDLALLTPPADVPPPRFDRRRALLGQFDRFRRCADTVEVGGMDSAYRRAFDVLTSDKVARALDLSREDPRLRARYGFGSPQHIDDAAPRYNDQFLIARRLVEAGVRCVTIAFGSWDMHGGNFARLKQQLPIFDQAVSALIEDIHNRGLENDVTVVAWGDFGRTPKINKDAGRDHWARVSMAMLAGGGMRVGQVIGSTDKLGGSAASRPVHYQDVLATIYHNMGIDPHAFINDKSNRPVSILPPTVEAIRELV
ncbi:MAG: DUF1501 domain-containing protein [Isosphaeraceae bacterium]